MKGENMLTTIQELTDHLRSRLDAVYRRGREEGYAQALADVKDALEQDNPTYYVRETSGVTFQIVAGPEPADGNIVPEAPKLSPIRSRVLKDIHDHPGSTRAQIQARTGTTGQGTLYDLVHRGLVIQRPIKDPSTAGRTRFNFWPASAAQCET